MTESAVITTRIWGRQIDLLCPSPRDIELVDVATGLARAGRYARMCPTYYSVAEHSWLLAAACVKYFADLLAADPASFRRLQLRCLLHDGSEAYLSDMPGPLKITSFLAGYRQVEAKVQAAVYKRWTLPVACPEGHVRRVSLLDRLMVAEEMEVLWGVSPYEVRKEFDVGRFASDHDATELLLADGNPRHRFGVQGFNQDEALGLFLSAMETVCAGQVFEGHVHRIARQEF